MQIKKLKCTVMELKIHWVCSITGRRWQKININLKIDKIKIMHSKVEIEKN